MIKLIELLAFAVSAAAFCGGALCVFKKGVPNYFKMYVFAAGCYMLEELWVIVNSLLGTGSQDGLVTVRLFGFFGCLCFMLSANTSKLDFVADKVKSRGAGVLSLIAPAVLLALYALYAFSPVNAGSIASVIIGLFSISPALPASRFSLKNLLQKGTPGMGILMAIDVFALIFYAANYLYPLADLYFTKAFMSIYDLVLALMLFIIIILCGRGAAKWKVQI